jgi:TonB family protein
MNRIATTALVGMLIALPVHLAMAQETDEANPGAGTPAPPAPPADVLALDVAPPEIDPGPADGYAVGPLDAAVTIEEYTDYLCGYCREFEDRVARPLREKYAGPGGSVRWVTRIHPNIAGSWDGAVAAWCAARQSRFWEVHDELFARSDEWSGERRSGSVFLEIARERGLDVERYEACLADPGSRSEVVEGYFAEARENERRTCGTPVLFVNGMVVPRDENYYSLEGLESVIRGDQPVREGESECLTPATRPSPIPIEYTQGSEPALLNPDEVTGALARHYPQDLREAGIGGSVTLWLFVDPSGSVTRFQVYRSSGYDGVDRAAARVVGEMRFEPARNAGEPVGVWVAQQFDLSF